MIHQHNPIHSVSTILLVDDDPIVLSSVEVILTRDDRNLLTAESGASALRIAQEHDFQIDLLVSDIVMPGMNGIELSWALYERIPGLRVLFISGYPGEFDMSKAPKHAILLEKPFKSIQLNNLVDRVFEGADRIWGQRRNQR
jgi:two-component system cell cycle sensor histidine kinase/response regulator CckA